MTVASAMSCDHPQSSIASETTTTHNHNTQPQHTTTTQQQQPHQQAHTTTSTQHINHNHNNHNHNNHSHHNHSLHNHHNHPSLLSSVAWFCWVTFFFVMDLRGRCAAAKNTLREPRRSWVRHERMTVAKALAEMTHQTTPRGPKMARAGEEGLEDLHDAPRRQKPLLPSRSSSACTKKSPAGGGHPVCVSRPCPRHGFSGTPPSR